MTQTLVLERLTPQGAPDYEAKTMPTYRNEVTGETGDLADLSAKVGTCWLADWCPGKPLLARMPDGSTATLELTEPSYLGVHHRAELAGFSKPLFVVHNKPKRRR